MIKRDDIIWLGGLLEGEGCFHLNRGKYPVISVGMTAEDTITKVADMWGNKVSRRRNMYIVQVCGGYAIGWMMTLYPFLGSCRKKRIREIIEVWRKATYAYGLNWIRAMAKCHPDRKAHAFDLCKPCYQRQWYEKKQLLEMVG